MVKSNELFVRSNVKITEIQLGKQHTLVETHNSVTRISLHYIASKILDKYISDNFSNHVLNLIGFGYGASDICTLPSPATLYDTNLVMFHTLQQTPGFSIYNNRYVDITNYITYTSETSWKISIVITDSLFSTNINPLFLNEIGVFVSDKNTKNNPKLFARVTTSPVILKTGRVYVLEWNFSLSHE